jgi:HAD superfamily hydrolase (TIGR01490 family)
MDPSPGAYGQAAGGRDRRSIRATSRAGKTLLRMLRAVAREAAFFDLDKTVIARASMAAFGRTLYEHGFLSRTLLLRGLWAHLVFLHMGADEEKLARIRESVLALTKGWDQARIRAVVREALEEVIEPIIYAEALELIESHRSSGRSVVIVSASPAEIVEPLADYLEADHAIASRALVDDDGRYTGQLELYAYGRHKAEAMSHLAAAQGFDLSRSYAYSDSATDLPMLEAVGHPVAVNPDRELQRAARERDWEVRRFERPVRLRDRMPAPPPAATAAVGGGIVVGATAVATVWWRRRQRLRRPPPPWERLGAPLRRRAPSWRRPPRGR